MGMINQMPMPMNAINGSGMMPMGYGQMAPNMMPMQSQNMASMMQQNRPMMSGPPPLMNRPPPFSTGTQAVSNVSAAQAMNSLFRNQQQSTNLLPPGTAGMVPPGTHVNPHVYPQFGENLFNNFEQSNQFFVFRSAKSTRWLSFGCFAR